MKDAKENDSIYETIYAFLKMINKTSENFRKNSAIFEYPKAILKKYNIFYRIVFAYFKSITKNKEYVDAHKVLDSVISFMIKATVNKEDRDLYVQVRENIDSFIAKAKESEVVTFVQKEIDGTEADKKEVLYTINYQLEKTSNTMELIIKEPYNNILMDVIEKAFIDWIRINATKGKQVSLLTMYNEATLKILERKLDPTTFEKISNFPLIEQANEALKAKVTYLTILNFCDFDSLTLLEKVCEKFSMSLDEIPEFIEQICYFADDNIEIKL